MTTPDTRVKTYPAKKEGDHNGMVGLAREVEEHYLQPIPEATEPVPDPFPPMVTWGLWLGVLVGAGLGLIAALLLFNGALVLPGWESMFSMAPFAFYVFWIVVGIAAGLLVIGVAAILLASPEPETQTEAKS